MNLNPANIEAWLFSLERLRDLGVRGVMVPLISCMGGGLKT